LDETEEVFIENKIELAELLEHRDLFSFMAQQPYAEDDMLSDSDMSSDNLPDDILSDSDMSSDNLPDGDEKMVKLRG